MLGYAITWRVDSRTLCGAFSAWLSLFHVHLRSLSRSHIYSPMPAVLVVLLYSNATVQRRPCVHIVPLHKHGRWQQFASVCVCVFCFSWFIACCCVPNFKINLLNVASLPLNLAIYVSPRLLLLPLCCLSSPSPEDQAIQPKDMPLSLSFVLLWSRILTDII